MNCAVCLIFVTGSGIPGMATAPPVATVTTMAMSGTNLGTIEYVVNWIAEKSEDKMVLEV